MRTALCIFVAVLAIGSCYASITSELEAVLGKPKKQSLTSILLSYDPNSPHRHSEMNSIVAKLDEFAQRLAEEDKVHWEHTQEAVVRDNVTAFEKDSEVLMMQAELEHEEVMLQERIKAHDRELALLETIHRHIGTAHAEVTQGAVKARNAEVESSAQEAAQDPSVVAAHEAAAAAAGRKEGGGFHHDDGAAAKVAAYLDKFAKRLLGEEKEDREEFETYRREVKENQAELRLEVEELKEKITLAYTTYRKAKEERDQQLGLVASVKAMIAADAAKTVEQRVAEDKARGGSTWWNHYIKEANMTEVKANSKYVSDNFTPTPTGWRPWSGAPKASPQ